MENQNRNKETGLLALLGMAVLPMLCCGLPLLIGAIGFTAVGTFLTADRYWIIGGLVILMGLIMFLLLRRGRKSAMDACCVVPPRKDLSPKENQ